jgi:hypothetical protein
MNCAAGSGRIGSNGTQMRSEDQRKIFEHSRSQFSEAIILRSRSLSCAMERKFHALPLAA